MISKEMQPYYNDILEGWGFQNTFWATEEDTAVSKSLDQKLHVDALFRDPNGFRASCQGKDLSHEHERRYQTLTVTCHKPGDNLNVRRSELFTCMANYFMCGYRNKDQNGVVSAIIVDFKKFRDYLFTKLSVQDILDAEKDKHDGNRHRYLDVGDVVFVRVSFCELIDAWPSDIVVDTHFTEEGKQTLLAKRRAHRIGQNINFAASEEAPQEGQS